MLRRSNLVLQGHQRFEFQDPGGGEGGGVRSVASVVDPHDGGVATGVDGIGEWKRWRDRERVNGFLFLFFVLFFYVYEVNQNGALS